MPFFTVFRGLAVCLLVAPVLVVLSAWLQWDASSAVVWQGLLNTVLPDYTRTSLFLCALVAIGVVSIGAVSAAAVTLFDFPGRQTLSWLLLLPLAMPAYVVAYAYTDFCNTAALCNIGCDSKPVGKALFGQIFAAPGARRWC